MSELMENESPKTNYKKIFSQSFLAKLLIIVFRVIKNAVLARVLGPTDRGVLSLIVSLSDLVMTVTSVGVGNAAAYHIIKSKALIKTIVGNANSFIIIAYMISIPIVTYLLYFSDLVASDNERAAGYLLFVYIAVPMLLCKILNTNILHVLHKTDTINVLSVLDTVLPLILFLVLWAGFNVEALDAAIYGWIVSLSLMAFSSIYYCRQGFPVRADADWLGKIAGYGGRSYFDTIFQKALLRIDFIFVSNLIDNEALGYYAIATAAAELMLVIPNALVIPFFSYLVKGKEDQKVDVISMVLRILLFIVLIKSLFFAIIGESVIYLLFGSEFLPAYAPLLCLLPGMLFLSYRNIIVLVLFMDYNRPGSVSIASGLSVAVNIGLNLVLIPMYGVSGAAVASSVSYFLSAVILFYLYKRESGVGFCDSFIIKISDIKSIVNKVRAKML